MVQKKERCFEFDNFRFLLIFCVVFGHLLEIVSADGGAKEIRNFLYYAIYSFHMPAFLFLSGYFAKPEWKRIFRLLLLYVIFQTLYLFFARNVMGTRDEIQYVTPYWILWYLLCMVYCCILTPVLDRVCGKGRFCVVALCILVSLLAGCFESIGYEFSASRFLTFLPHFVIGFYMGKEKEQVRRLLSGKPRLWMWLGICAVLLTVCSYFSGSISKYMQYGAYPYSLGYHAGIRLFLLVLADLWIGAFMAFFVSKLNVQIPVVSYLGRNTLPVFLLHGFAVKLISRFAPPGDSVFLAFVYALILVLALGSPLTGRLPGGSGKTK